MDDSTISTNGLPEVTIYTTPGCQPCRATQRALENALIPFDTVDLTADEAARQMVLDLGYTSAPVVVVIDPDGTMSDHWSGYRPDRIKALARELEPMLVDLAADWYQTQIDDPEPPMRQGAVA